MNLSLQDAKSAGLGYSFCACMITCTLTDAPASTTPLLGRTTYFFGAVVLTLNAVRMSLPLLIVMVDNSCLLSAKRKRSSLGVTETPPPPTPPPSDMLRD
eukprot:364180-Chlamydomonas_euryale.AAC.21